MRRLFHPWPLSPIGLLCGGLIALNVAGLITVLSMPPVYAQAVSKRLIMKDGSYQGVTKWEVKGDRVRYFSAERYQWEELPNSLVDWPATEKYNASPRSSDPSARTDAREVDAEERAEREKEEAATPAVAPGLRLPQSGGVLMLDTYRGQPQLVEMGQSGAAINRQTGKNILRAVVNPLPTGSRQSIELKGAHAPVQSHVTRPEIYANVQTGDPSDPGGTGRTSSAQFERYRIVRVQDKKDVRVVSNVKVSLIGKVNQEEDAIQSVSQAMSSGWVKVTPSENLAPGEYALVEMLGPKQMNLYVWDFGVNPSAPQNSSAWKPVQPGSSPPMNDNPALNKRPK